MVFNLKQDDLKCLRDEGYVVVDGFLDQDVANAIRSEAEAFASSGRMPAHTFQFGGSMIAKPHIFEADLHNETFQEELPSLAELLFDDSLVDLLSDAMPDLALARGPKGKTIKMQHNEGSGGCFPWHYDNAGPPNQRAITCIVYLNPAWCPGDGGEIVLAPFLRPQVVISPLHRRAALFRSDLLLHRVLPARAARFCFSIWLDGANTNGDQDCNLTSRHLLTAPDFLQWHLSPVHRAVSRAVYAEEYEASLRECLEGSESFDRLLLEHAQHVAGRNSHPSLGPFLKQLREKKDAINERIGVE